MAVAFSCKRTGFCPSCTRRMSDSAAHLVDEVLPDVPIRQWVCAVLASSFSQHHRSELEGTMRLEPATDHAVSCEPAGEREDREKDRV